MCARDVHLEQGGARNIIANRVTMGRQSGAFLILARSVEGDVRSLFDWRGALAFAAAFAVVTAFLRQLFGTDAAPVGLDASVAKQYPVSVRIEARLG